MEIIEIENLDIYLKVGTPIVSSTIIMVILLSSVIPILYDKTDNKSGRLFYKIVPNFNRFELVGKINLECRVTILELIWIIRYLKKKNDKKVKRRRSNEQSSYRGFNEYGYE